MGLKPKSDNKLQFIFNCSTAYSVYIYVEMIKYSTNLKPKADI